MITNNPDDLSAADRLTISLFGQDVDDLLNKHEPDALVVLMAKKSSYRNDAGFYDINVLFQTGVPKDARLRIFTDVSGIHRTVH